MKIILVINLIFLCLVSGNELVREKDDELSLNKFFCKLLSSKVLRCGFKREPVCGTDNKTYTNYCHLAQASCQSSTPLQLASRGKCESEGCAQFCTEEFDPVCATNGVTYSNKCHFEKALCEAVKKGEEKFSIKHKGRCARCPRACLKIYLPLCGSDGKTYSNICELGNAQCKARLAGKEVPTLAYKGKCQKCPKFCLKIYEPVCATDGITYNNNCELEKAQCLARKEGKTVPVYESDGKCDCPKYCPLYYDPVCASNGRTYSNTCFFNIAVCNGAEITIVHPGRCGKDAVLKVDKTLNSS